jgi:hypothetical protein
MAIRARSALKKDNLAHILRPEGFLPVRESGRDGTRACAPANPGEGDVGPKATLLAGDPQFFECLIDVPCQTLELRDSCRHPGPENLSVSGVGKRTKSSERERERLRQRCDGFHRSQQFPNLGRIRLAEKLQRQMELLRARLLPVITAAIELNDDRPAGFGQAVANFSAEVDGSEEADGFTASSC